MNYSRSLRVLFAAVLVAGFSSGAFAQATRTWVSGVGDDVNPCSRTAPCKTYAGAISKTATGGEISVLDPGGYGALTITKAITVDGGTGAGWGSTLFASTNGFTINITTNLTSDKVILRNLSMNGGVITSLGVDGIRFLDGEELTVENVVIFNFSGDGIEVNQAQAAKVNIKNVTISHGAIGIKASAAAGVVMNLQDVRINSMSSHGVQVINNMAAYARDVRVMRSGGDGFRADGTIGNSLINCSSAAAFACSGIGFNVGNNGIIRITNCDVYNNATGIAGANIRSGGGNKFAGNGANGAPGVTDIVTQ